jgi:hypothetical protein
LKKYISWGYLLIRKELRMVIMASYLEVPGTMITTLEFHYVRTEVVFD